ncbi:hypothetical protein [Opitutus sp. ER46]|uniref:hypothetical protein n=1 Tax=Opitutus sp. ER46 TaxID=2161864 RepID=UPI0011B23F28|nr:hypothetical protein [Opitutus sp. ER46]
MSLPLTSTSLRTAPRATGVSAGTAAPPHTDVLQTADAPRGHATHALPERLVAAPRDQPIAEAESRAIYVRGLADFFAAFSPLAASKPEA